MEISEIINMTEEKRKELFQKGIKSMYENYDENTINRDIAKNAVKYLKNKDKEFENYSDEEIKLVLFGLYKFANG